MSKLNLTAKTEVTKEVDPNKVSLFNKSVNLDSSTLRDVRSSFSETHPEFGKGDFSNLQQSGPIERLQKGFVAGTGITPETQPDGAALRRESLDNDVKFVTWSLQNLTIFQDIAKQPIAQTVAKYIVYYNHGHIGHSLFQPEIGLGRTDNPNLKQKTVTMKFLAAPAQTSMVMQRAQVVEDPIRIQELGALSRLDKTIEWAIFYGDADLSRDTAGNGLEFDGLTKLIDEENVIDQRGKGISPALLNQAAVAITTHGFGTPNVAYMPTGVKADFVNNYLGAQRVIVPNPQQGGMEAGFDIDRFRSVQGPIALRGSAVMDIDNNLDESAIVEDNAPDTPTVTASVLTDQSGAFLDSDITEEDGSVAVPKEVGVALSYKVVAVGKSDSAPSDVVTATPANKTDGVQLTISIAPLAQKAPDYVAIYRESLIESQPGYKLIARVPVSKLDTSTGTITFVDVDSVIPGTADVFVGEMSPDVINLFEFLPVTKLDTAVITDATNFALLWWGALRLSFPKRWVWLQNVRYSSKDTPVKYN